jgi:cysteine desulfurase
VRAFEKESGARILVHTDAAQAPLWLSCALDSLGVDVLSLDAGKCYGPKGVGVLACVHDAHLAPHFFGGDQEGGLRPGTENTGLIVGAAESLCIAQDGYKSRSERATVLRDIFFAQLETIEGVVRNGSQEDRVANNINISIPGIDSEFAVITLDEKGIACATKSACGGARGDGSSVVFAITQDKERATSTLRFSLGEETTIQELEQTGAILKAHVAKIRAALALLKRVD